MADLDHGGIVKKYHVALFVNTGTALAPNWVRIKKSTDNTITMNAETKEYDFIADESPTTILDKFKPTLSQPLTMIKDEPDYEYFFDKFFEQATGERAITELLIVFKGAKIGNAIYKAWKTEIMFSVNNMNPVESTITADITFNADTQKGTAAIVDGVPVFTDDTHTYFQLAVTVTNSGTAVEGATVVIGGTELTTDEDGKAYFQVEDGKKYTLGAYDGDGHSATEIFTADESTDTKTVAIS